MPQVKGQREMPILACIMASDKSSAEQAAGQRRNLHKEQGYHSE